MRKGLVIGGMVIGLLMGCNNGLAEQLEKKSSFYDSVIKIGHEFQGIFGVFGDAIGNVLGFNAVKSGDPKSKVGDHFNKVKQGLENTKGKLKEISGKISETKNADGGTTKVVEDSIKGASDVFDKLIGSLTKLADVTKENTPIAVDYSGKPAGADGDDVKAIIGGVKEIIETATSSGVKIEPGSDNGNPVANSDGDKAPAALFGKSNNKAGAKAGLLLAGEVAKADSWSMISKIEKAKISVGDLTQTNNNEVVALATKATSHANNTGAKSTADLVAAVALKAMTKSGKFSVANNDEEVGTVQAAAASAVNKVLAVLDEIIRRTVSKNLEKVREAVEKINYSDSNGEATEAKK